MTRPRSAWLAGLVVGAAGGFASLEVPVVGWPLLLAFLGPALLSGSRAAAIGGLFVGGGAIWTVLIGRVALTCHAPDCLAPGIDSWLAAGLVVLAVGALLTAVAIARR